MKTQKIKQVLLGLIVPAVIVAAWICATHFGSIPTSILPRISMVWQAFLEMLQSGQLWNDLSVTLSRVLLPALRRIGNGSGVSDGNVKDDSQSAAANGDGDPADPYHCMDSADYSLVRHRRIVQGGGDRYGGILPHYDEHHERHLQYAGRLYRGGAAV